MLRFSKSTASFVFTSKVSLTLVTTFFTLFVFMMPTAEGQHWASPYIEWIKIARTSGIVEGYLHVGDIYPPGVFTILASFDKVFNSPLLALKAAQLVFFLLGTVCLFVLTRSVFATVVFQAGVFLSQLYFASVDIFFVPFFFMGLIGLLRRNYFMAGFWLASTLMIKWQPVFLAPFLFLLLINVCLKTREWKPLMLATVGAVIAVTIWICVFGPKFVLKLFEAGASGATSLSAYTFNLGLLVTYFRTGSVYQVADANGLVAMKVFFSIYYFIFLGGLAAKCINNRTNENRLFFDFAFVGGFAFCVLFPGIHANYWIVPLLVFSVSSFIQSRTAAIYLVAMASINLLLLAAMTLPERYPLVFKVSIPVSLALSAANVIFLIWQSIYLHRNYWLSERAGAIENKT